MKIILAAHPDDEVIGCFRILKQGVDVVYYFVWDDLRKQEALTVSQYFGFTPIFLAYDGKISVSSNDTVYVPCKEELHPAHLAINMKARKLKCKKIYYSIEKNIPFISLNRKEKIEKEQILNTYYKSQRFLWENNKKYIFFEAYKTKEHEIWNCFKILETKSLQVTLYILGDEPYPNFVKSILKNVPKIIQNTQLKKIAEKIHKEIQNSELHKYKIEVQNKKDHILLEY